MFSNLNHNALTCFANYICYRNSSWIFDPLIVTELTEIYDPNRYEPNEYVKLVNESQYFSNVVDPQRVDDIKAGNFDREIEKDFYRIKSTWWKNWPPSEEYNGKDRDEMVVLLERKGNSIFAEPKYSQASMESKRWTDGINRSFMTDVDQLNNKGTLKVFRQKYTTEKNSVFESGFSCSDLDLIRTYWNGTRYLLAEGMAPIQDRSTLIPIPNVTNLEEYGLSNDYFPRQFLNLHSEKHSHHRNLPSISSLYFVNSFIYGTERSLLYGKNPNKILTLDLKKEKDVLDYYREYGNNKNNTKSSGTLISELILDCSNLKTTKSEDSFLEMPLELVKYYLPMFSKLVQTDGKQSTIKTDVDKDHLDIVPKLIFAKQTVLEPTYGFPIPTKTKNELSNIMHNNVSKHIGDTLSSYYTITSHYLTTGDKVKTGSMIEEHFSELLAPKLSLFYGEFVGMNENKSGEIVPIEHYWRDFNLTDLYFLRNNPNPNPNPKPNVPSEDKTVLIYNVRQSDDPNAEERESANIVLHATQFAKEHPWLLYGCIYNSKQKNNEIVLVPYIVPHYSNIFDVNLKFSFYTHSYAAQEEEPIWLLNWEKYAYPGTISFASKGEDTVDPLLTWLELFQLGYDSTLERSKQLATTGSAQAEFNIHNATVQSEEQFLGFRPKTSLARSSNTFFGNTKKNSSKEAIMMPTGRMMNEIQDYKMRTGILPYKQNLMNTNLGITYYLMSLRSQKDIDRISEKVKDSNLFTNLSFQNNYDMARFFMHGVYQPVNLLDHLKFESDFHLSSMLDILLSASMNNEQGDPINPAFDFLDEDVVHEYVSGNRYVDEQLSDLIEFCRFCGYSFTTNAISGDMQHDIYQFINALAFTLSMEPVLGLACPNFRGTEKTQENQYGDKRKYYPNLFDPCTSMKARFYFQKMASVKKLTGELNEREFDSEMNMLLQEDKMCRETNVFQDMHGHNESTNDFLYSLGKFNETTKNRLLSIAKKNAAILLYYRNYDDITVEGKIRVKGTHEHPKDMIVNGIGDLVHTSTKIKGALKESIKNLISNNTHFRSLSISECVNKNQRNASNYILQKRDSGLWDPYIISSTKKRDSVLDNKSLGLSKIVASQDVEDVWSQTSRRSSIGENNYVSFLKLFYSQRNLPINELSTSRTIINSSNESISIYPLNDVLVKSTKGQNVVKSLKNDKGTRFGRDHFLLSGILLNSYENNVYEQVNDTNLDTFFDHVNSIFNSKKISEKKIAMSLIRLSARLCRNNGLGNMYSYETNVDITYRLLSSIRDTDVEKRIESSEKNTSQDRNSNTITQNIKSFLEHLNKNYFSSEIQSIIREREHPAFRRLKQQIKSQTTIIEILEREKRQKEKESTQEKEEEEEEEKEERDEEEIISEEEEGMTIDKDIVVPTQILFAEQESASTKLAYHPSITQTFTSEIQTGDDATEIRKGQKVDKIEQTKRYEITKPISASSLENERLYAKPISGDLSLPVRIEKEVTESLPANVRITTKLVTSTTTTNVKTTTELATTTSVLTTEYKEYTLPERYEIEARKRKLREEDIEKDNSKRQKLEEPKYDPEIYSTILREYESLYEAQKGIYNTEAPLKPKNTFNGKLDELITIETKHKDFAKQVVEKSYSDLISKLLLLSFDKDEIKSYQENTIKEFMSFVDSRIEIALSSEDFDYVLSYIRKSRIKLKGAQNLNTLTTPLAESKFSPVRFEDRGAIEQRDIMNDNFYFPYRIKNISASVLYKIIEYVYDKFTEITKSEYFLVPGTKTKMDYNSFLIFKNHIESMITSRIQLIARPNYRKLVKDINIDFDKALSILEKDRIPTDPTRTTLNQVYLWKETDVKNWLKTIGIKYTKFNAIFTQWSGVELMNISPQKLDKILKVDEKELFLSERAKFESLGSLFLSDTSLDSIWYRLTFSRREWPFTTTQEGKLSVEEWDAVRKQENIEKTKLLLPELIKAQSLSDTSGRKFHTTREYKDWIRKKENFNAYTVIITLFHYIFSSLVIRITQAESLIEDLFTPLMLYNLKSNSNPELGTWEFYKGLFDIVTKVNFVNEHGEITAIQKALHYDSRITPSNFKIGDWVSFIETKEKETESLKKEYIFEEIDGKIESIQGNSTVLNNCNIRPHKRTVETKRLRRTSDILYRDLLYWIEDIMVYYIDNPLKNQY